MNGSIAETRWRIFAGGAMQQAKRARRRWRRRAARETHASSTALNSAHAT
jgi:hypothetical protein